MKKAGLFLATVVALVLGLSAGATAWACDREGSACDCAKKHAPEGETQAVQVSLEGKVESYGCQMKAAKLECTGAALVVGEKKHFIKKAKKGEELVKKAKGTDKVVKVSGTKQGEFLTVSSFEIGS
jgi:hypothetical protein